MKEQLVLPTDYPLPILRDRAVEKLQTDLDRAIMLKTGFPIRLAGLLIGLLVVKIYADTVAGGLAQGAMRTAVNLAEMIIVAALASSLCYALLWGRRLQRAFAEKVEGIRDESLSPLVVLNARLEDVQVDTTPAIEPKDILASQRRSGQKAFASQRAAQAEREEVAPGAINAPSLADSVVSPKEGGPRSISL